MRAESAPIHLHSDLDDIQTANILIRLLRIGDTPAHSHHVKLASLVKLVFFWHGIFNIANVIVGVSAVWSEIVVNQHALLRLAFLIQSFLSELVHYLLQHWEALKPRTRVFFGVDSVGREYACQFVAFVHSAIGIERRTVMIPDRF